MSNQNPKSQMLNPQYLMGNKHKDDRGIITYNNDFDASQIRRIYTIVNQSTDFVRGWQGHKMEQRWFAAMKGSFEISVIQVDDFNSPSKDLPIHKYTIVDNELTYLHIPAGCITAIKSLVDDSKLLVLADYQIGQIQDEFRFDINYFNEKL